MAPIFDEDGHCVVLKGSQDINDQDKDTLRDHIVIPIGSSVVILRRWWTLDIWYSNRA